MAHFTHNMIPLRFVYQIYSLMVICCFCSGISLLGMAFLALYGMGGKELCLAISSIALYGVVRLCIPPWDETRNSLFSRNTRRVKVLAVDKFTLGEKQEVSISPCCPICLHDFQAGKELSRGRVCGHVFCSDCLGMWLPKSTTCPYCRQDLEEFDTDTPADHVQKSGSAWKLFDGIFDSFYA